mgnify:CR=1 FL=1|tara:strand:- start:225 stop:491 length:267 start_codon:yes stop_codon:yes gene_type:complete
MNEQEIKKSADEIVEQHLFVYSVKPSSVDVFKATSSAIITVNAQLEEIRLSRAWDNIHEIDKRIKEKEAILQELEQRINKYYSGLLVR